MDLWKSSCDLPHFTAWNDTNHRIISRILHDDMTQIISSFNAICNVFIVQRWRRCTYYSLRLASAYLRLCMIEEINAVGVMPAFQWMYLAKEIASWCNAVGVVLLIAQGWRGTSLPWVNGCREIQRCKCWAFLRKHGYSEGIYNGLRLESVTPAALKHSIRNMNYVISRQKIW